MSPTDGAVGPTTQRRRSSVMLRVRPRTAVSSASPGASPQMPAWPPSDSWSPSREVNRRDAAQHFMDEQTTQAERWEDHDAYNQEGPYNIAHALEEPPAFAEPGSGHRSGHRSAKSFSSLRHGVDGLRALGRRLSVSLRSKSSKHGLRVPLEEGPEDESAARSQFYGSWEGRSRTSWFKHHGLHRRPSLPTVTALQSLYAPAGYVLAPIPGNGTEPPVLPDGPFGGTAARAAAAAQNELTNAERAASKADSKIWDGKITRDSESGIGIDLRDRSEMSDAELAVVRIDPVEYLPTEVMAQVLSCLDPESLMNAEAVSHAWRNEASSRHVWRTVFRREFGPRRHETSLTRRKTQSAGLGKTLPDQDWKRMFMVRQALEHRWKEGEAAAIYLQGHKDSVYCVQFDEHKIITGSRDRTIRVWNAHYPWQCLKIIGPPPGDSAGVGPNVLMNLTAHSSEKSKSPIVTICPPSKPTAGLVAPLEESGDYHSASILCLQFDDEIMVTGSSDYTCIVWDVKNDYKAIRRLEGHKAGVLDVCFDDRYIVSCSKDTTICVWDRHTGELVKKLLGHRGPVNAVQLRGDLVVSASGDGVAKLWNITSGLCIKEFPSKDRGLACVEFSEDARTILAGGNDQVIYQFDANTGELVNELKGHAGLVRSLHLDDMNNRIVSGSYDMSVKVFDATTGDLSINMGGWTTSWMLSAKSDYRRIVATSQDSRAVIMDFGHGLDGIELLEE
ncbi:hypothetical protein DTO021D3_7849 [Paecilomyces variotii]|nr:hypothetical protein DTO032I3_8513 [Paecilomyces variotii]KAJ9275311.1 hypothetical protein DTO021D3_7849 [Paecilomyces variotii]KAJ9339273.1 hypothetical protein DTO027B6_8156 [Paecilomyces variotii]KAJ9378451.1 hypothetical protein DTO032I4_7701 [Paecilomyces variotii]KAJ9410937.1 hypothetical protein DTO045G8_1258 [Paecilomyces variotii]